MPGGSAGSPLPRHVGNEGWAIEGRCPHGVIVRIPMDLVQSWHQFNDPCPEAVIERTEAELAVSAQRGRFSMWVEQVRFRFLMRKGVPWLSRKDIEPKNG